MISPSMWESVSCPFHPEAAMRRFGYLGRCSDCGHAIDLCRETFGFKECQREVGHEGPHVSQSGSAWPNFASGARAPADALRPVADRPEGGQ